jgi:transcriptional repressor NrdR
MECPFCGKIDNDVIDSRLSKDGLAIRRRRRCVACAGRFTTFESTPEHMLYLLMKRQVGQGATRKNLETIINATSRAFKGLAEEIERLSSRIEKVEKPSVAAKVKKKVAAKKKPVAKKAKKKKAPAKPAAVRKAAKLTDTAKVLKVIKSHRKGIDIAKLKSKTGFNDQKVRSIVSRVFKQGKITRIGRGMYVAT